MVLRSYANTLDGPPILLVRITDRDNRLVSTQNDHQRGFDRNDVSEKSQTSLLATTHPSIQDGGPRGEQLVVDWWGTTRRSTLVVTINPRPYYYYYYRTCGRPGV